uniref:ubiquitinyl hydrolase 1 n=1 Tax=Daphnia galeata TaxID=27404 RepID=A0A8J2RGT0_9CRUS|nr:unnamed protein product [Daphnia galeata]
MRKLPYSIDPYLVKFLVYPKKKTDKSMAELEIDLNQRCDSGPFPHSAFQERFFHDSQAIFAAADTNAFQDLNVQMAKLAVGILFGRYSVPVPDVEIEYQQGIKPSMFKSLIGRGHPEFSTKRQQDAIEFLLHLINRHTRVHPKSTVCPAESFKFRVEERLQCLSSGKVRYTHRPEYNLPVPVPLETASNMEEVRLYNEQKKAAMAAGQHISDDIVRPKITLQSCLEALVRPEEVQNFYSTAISGKTTALKITKLATTPDFLWIQLRKFTLAEDWSPVKLDVAVEIPQILDLSFMKASGQQPDEILMPDQVTAADAAAEPPFDMAIVESLIEMGFPLVACKRAATLTHDRGLEAATQWIMEHMDDPDFLAPPPSSASGTFKPDEEGVAMLQSMGFSRSQCVKALKNTDNNLFSASTVSAPSASEPTFTDGPPVYELAAFISHMGTSTSVGHYVCHIKRDGRWVIFNDEKVAVSENPPFELGYLYLYRRSSMN